MVAFMQRFGWRALFATAGILLPLSLLSAQPPVPTPPASKVGFILKDRHGHATPARTSSAHTGAGNTDVVQVRDDTVVITMTGVAVAGPYPRSGSSAMLSFDLNQEFEIAFADPKLKKARLIVEAQIVGLLRGDKHGGSAGACDGTATVVAVGGASIVSLAIEGHSVAGDENLAINDHKGPLSATVRAGEHHLFQTFRISAAHARTILGKAASAEFAPDPALDPTWISVTEPFHGAAKKDFGFRVTLRVEPD
jgi:hypothetical protein